MSYKSTSPLYRSLTDEQEIDFRKWARDNYTPHSPISEVWHPVVREECELINAQQKRPKITTHIIPTAQGNAIQVFYNPENNLLVVDLCNDFGGNELLRKTLNERALLSHATKTIDNEETEESDSESDC